MMGILKFLWRWPLPIIGAMTVGLLVWTCATYISLLHYLKSSDEFHVDVLNEIVGPLVRNDESQALKELRTTSPDGKIDIVLAVFPKEIEDVLALTFEDGAGLFVVESGKVVDPYWPVLRFWIEKDKYIEVQKGQVPPVSASWADDRTVEFTYCGVSIFDAENFAAVGDAIVEVNIRRADGCKFTASNYWER